MRIYFAIFFWYLKINMRKDNGGVQADVILVD